VQVEPEGVWVGGGAVGVKIDVEVGGEDVGVTAPEPMAPKNTVSLKVVRVKPPTA
jgi:hypothetical protein